MKTAPLVQFHRVAITFERKRSERTNSLPYPAPSLFDIDFELYKQQRVGLIGETGSGKTTLGRLLVGLIKPTRGRIVYEGRDVSSLSSQEWRSSSEHYRMVFQNARNSFDPNQPIGESILDCFKHHRKLKREEAKECIEAILPKLDLRKDLLKSFPHEASLGEMKRFSILRTLSGSTTVLVADEPTASLDRKTAQLILDLFHQLNQDDQIALLLISHDIDMVIDNVEKLYVLYQGRLLEELSICQSQPIRSLHPYTGLLMDPAKLNGNSEPLSLVNNTASNDDSNSGCVFLDHCFLCRKLGDPDDCRSVQPELREVEPGHKTACWHYAELA
ncbi:MAG: ATP-binding cassette domain-containing protein [bacterium]